MTAARPPSVSDGRSGSLGPSLPRITLSLTEAAEVLGVSLDFFSAHIAPELAVVRRGRRKLVRVAELERWAFENEERVPS